MSREKEKQLELCIELMNDLGSKVFEISDQVSRELGLKEINNMTSVSELPPIVEPQKPIKIVHKISQHKLNEALRFIGIDVGEYRLIDVTTLFHTIGTEDGDANFDYHFTFIDDIIKKEGT